MLQFCYNFITVYIKKTGVKLYLKKKYNLEFNNLD